MISIEKQIADSIAKASGLTVAKLGLRFDRVVARLLGGLRVSVESMIPNGETVIITVTAPIKVPAKTAARIEHLTKEFLNSGTRHRSQKLSIFQNQVSIRLVATKSKRAPQFIGLVHNPEIDPKMLLDLTAQWLFGEAKNQS